MDILMKSFKRPVPDMKMSKVQLHSTKNTRSNSCCKHRNQRAQTDKDSGMFDSSTASNASQRPSVFSSGVFSEVLSTSTSPNTTASSAYCSSAGLSCGGKKSLGSKLTTGFQDKSSNFDGQQFSSKLTKAVKHSHNVASTENVFTGAESSNRYQMSRSTSLKSEKTSTSKKNYMHDRIADKVYEKCQLLGKGGFARVYEVNEVCPHRENDSGPRLKMAAKVIDKSRIARASQRLKVENEIKLMKESCGHPNIVNYIDSFEDENSICILLELCSKKSLAQYLRRKACLRESEVCVIMQQIISGLAHLHSKGIVHRDLKLGNILLTEDMKVKIGDFGLAMRIDQEKRKTICGTPNFIAPEVLQRQGHGPESDIWSLGCLLYALIVGKSPFESSCLRETYRNILKNSYRIPTCISLEATDLIKLMLQHDPNQRPTLEKILSHSFFKKHAKKSLRKADFSTSNEPLSMPVSNPSFKENNETIEKTNSSVKSKTNARKQMKLLARCLQKKFNKSPSLKEKENKLQPNVDSTNQNQNACTASGTWVSKWVDYSNCYGFGYQLTNGRIGVLFNNGKHISINPVTEIIEYAASETSQPIVFQKNSVPACLKKYTNLLGSFTSFMDKSLSQKTEIAPISKENDSARLLAWCRTDEYIAMYFNDETFQLNFIKDHVKLGISSLHNKNDMVITFVDQKCRKQTYDVKNLAVSADFQLLEKLPCIHEQFHQFFDVKCGSQPICDLCFHNK